MAVKDTVESAIAESKITIFSKSYCPYCKRAKSLFASEFPGVPVKVLELDEIDEGSAIQDYLQEKTGQRSVPNVFVNQKHVGGSDTVVALNSKGELSALVNA
ncbi:hypothetical protein PLICRDRAFT_49142 [Plicaturopsis crispa FD-325 SS-3]|nr:hypothetical protein PLICRDRAFT_49142 [Plicaturopsis crispa FD-325 SS-3]